jgi:hypothetical protein
MQFSMGFTLSDVTAAMASFCAVASVSVVGAVLAVAVFTPEADLCGPGLVEAFFMFAADTAV